MPSGYTFPVIIRFGFEKLESFLAVEEPASAIAGLHRLPFFSAVARSGQITITTGLLPPLT